MNDMPGIQNLKVRIEKIEDEVTDEKNISLSMLRLDEIHPVISGNKLFKLHYFLQTVLHSSHKTIITFGGYYSNHLAATAFACEQNGLKCIGIVRGEKPETFSHTLLFCIQHGMQLEFICRKDYQRKNELDFITALFRKYGDHILIPEGGFGKEGVEGVALISHFYLKKNFTHVCCAVGTATTLAGLISSADPLQQVMGFSALKDISDFEERMCYLNCSANNYSLITDYHFRGYAQRTNELITFMNEFYSLHKIPLDFVYTAKMMFGVFDLIRKNFFDRHSNILCIHTGGLQGNLSLPQGILNF